jgi:cold shock CspA family protein
LCSRSGEKGGGDVVGKKMKGTLEWFNATTGSGFVTSIDHGEFLYFLQPSLKSHEISGDQNLKVGEAVEFGIMGDRYGCLRAFDITPLGGGVLSGGFDVSTSWNNNLGWAIDNNDDDYGGHNCVPVLFESMDPLVFDEMSHPCSEVGGAVPMFSEGSVFDEMSHPCSKVGGVVLMFSEDSVFDEMPMEGVIWDEEAKHGDMVNLEGKGDQTHNKCEQGVVPDAPWKLGDPLFSKVGLKVAWDGEMQFESHTYEGLLQQLAQGGEVLDESAEKEGEVVDETSRSDVPSEAATMVMHGGSMKELLLARAGSVIEDSLEKEQNATSEEEGKYLAVSKEGTENEVLQLQLADDEIREDKDNQTEVRKGNTANTLQGDRSDSALGLEEKHGDEDASKSTGHPSKVEDSQVHQVSKHPGPNDEAEPNQLRGSFGDLPEGSASSATTKIHQSGDNETGESIHTRMEDTSDRNILQAQLAESALEPTEPEESLAIEEVLVTTSNEADKESAAVIEVVPALCETIGSKEAAATEKAVKEADYYVVRNHIVVLRCSSPCTEADEYHAIVVAADFGDSAFNQFLDKLCRLRQVVVDGVPHGVEVTLGMALAAFRAARGVAAKHEAKLFLDWHLANLVYACAASLTDLSMALWDLYDPYEVSRDHCYIPGGSSHFVRAFTNGILIVYGQNVPRKQYGGDGLRVHGDKMAFHGDMILCTVPLGMLLLWITRPWDPGIFFCIACQCCLGTSNTLTGR